MGNDDTEPEGRILTLEYEEFYLVNVYTPNSQRDLARLPYRLNWEERILEHLLELDAMKPVIMTGDLNVAHSERDLKNAKSNRGNSGFTDEERDRMSRLLGSGFVDAFRYKYPEAEGAYTWWSYMAKVRERNIGWRIDYFIVSEKLQEKIIDSQIHCDIMGADHCPIALELNI